MNRINPQDVVEAYKKTGIKPTSKVWISTVPQLDGSELVCGCALSTLSVESENKEWMEELRRLDSHTIYTTLGRKFNVSKSYVEGFTMGFDDLRPNLDEESEIGIGFKDGVAARELVNKEVNKVIPYSFVVEDSKIINVTS